MNREHEVRLPDRFWRHSTKLSPVAKTLYAILLTFIDWNTGETHVGNPRLEKELGCGRDKVKELLLELENAGFIKRWRLFVGNLKSKRVLRCLKFLSRDGISVHRLDGRLFGQPKIRPISLPNHSSEPSQSHKSKPKTSKPLLAEKFSERIM